MKNKILLICLLFVLPVKSFGEKLGPILRLGRGFAPVIAYDSKNKNFFVVWSASLPPNGKLKGVQIDLDSSRSTARDYSLPLFQIGPDCRNILFDPRMNKFFLVWQEKNQNVFTRFVDSSGRASAINQIFANDTGFGVFGTTAVRQKLTGQYLINASSARLFILDQNGSILRKSDNLQFGSIKILSSLKGSGYSVFGSAGGNLVFQALNALGDKIGYQKLVLKEGSWWSLAFSELTVAFNSQNHQYLILYLAQPNAVINSIRVNASGNVTGLPHVVDRDISTRPELAPIRNGYRVFFTSVEAELLTRKLDFKGVPYGSKGVIYQSSNKGDSVSGISVASTLDYKNHLICWTSALDHSVYCRQFHE